MKKSTDSTRMLPNLKKSIDLSPDYGKITKLPQRSDFRSSLFMESNEYND